MGVHLQLLKLLTILGDASQGRILFAAYRDLQAETAVQVVRTAVASVRRAMQEANKRPQKQQPSEQQQPHHAGDASCAAGAMLNKDAGETGNRGGCSVSVRCTDEIMLTSLKEAVPLMAGLCDLPSKSFSISVLEHQQLHQNKQVEKKEDDLMPFRRRSFLSRVVMLPGSRSNSRGDRALELEVAASFGEGGGSSRAPSARRTQKAAEGNCRHRLSLQRKLQDLERRVTAPE